MPDKNSFFSKTVLFKLFTYIGMFYYIYVVVNDGSASKFRPVFVLFSAKRSMKFFKRTRSLNDRLEQGCSRVMRFDDCVASKNPIFFAIGFESDLHRKKCLRLHPWSWRLNKNKLYFCLSFPCIRYNLDLNRYPTICLIMLFTRKIMIKYLH